MDNDIKSLKIKAPAMPDLQLSSDYTVLMRPNEVQIWVSAHMGFRAYMSGVVYLLQSGGTIIRAMGRFPVYQCKMAKFFALPGSQLLRSSTKSI